MVVGLPRPTTTVLLRHGDFASRSRSGSAGSRRARPELSAEGGGRRPRWRPARGGRRCGRGLSSPLRRTRQTADAVAAGLGLDVREADGFRECALASGASRSPRSARVGRAARVLARRRDGAPARRGVFDDVRRRVKVARNKVLARFPERTVLVVTQ